MHQFQWEYFYVNKIKVAEFQVSSTQQEELDDCSHDVFDDLFMRRFFTQPREKKTSAAQQEEWCRSTALEGYRWYMQLDQQ